VGKKRDESAEQTATEPSDIDERHERIAKAAYLRAAARGFADGDPMRDWLEAERELGESAVSKVLEK
jgi:hypothetical protein